MQLDLNSPNVNYLAQVLKDRELTSRQLSQLILGEDTHRNIVNELKSKPDTRALTIVKVCRALNITMDSLYSSEPNKDIPTVDGNNNVFNSSHVRIEINNLRQENKALKMVIKEKEIREKDLKGQIDSLQKSVDSWCQRYDSILNMLQEVSKGDKQ